MAYFNEEIETLQRDELDALVDERIRYTVKYVRFIPHFIVNGSMIII